MSFDLLSVDLFGDVGDAYLVRIGSRALLHIERWRDRDTGKMRTRIGSALWIKF